MSERRLGLSLILKEIVAIMIFLLIIGFLYLKIPDGIKRSYKKRRG